MGPTDLLRRARVAWASGLIVAALLAGALPATAAPGGGGGSAPPFTLSTTSLSFPGTPVGTTHTQDVTLTAGRRAVAIQTSATSPFSDTHAGTCYTSYLALGSTIPARATCTIRVGYTPSTILSDGGFLTVTPCTKTSVVGGVLTCTRVDSSKAQLVQLGGQGLAPDLDVAGIALGDGGATECGYTVNVRNRGNITADLNGVSVQGYFEPTQTYNATTPAGGTSFGAGTTVAPGTTEAISVGCTGGGAVGDKYLVVRVDGTGAVVESDETNNDFALGLVDFEIGDVTIQGANGTNLFHHTVTLNNIGAGTYDGSALSRVTSYFSDDAVFDATDRGLDCQTTLVSPIAAESTLPIPRPCNSTPRAGENYLIAVVDPTESQYEARENNNTFVVPLPKDDLWIASETVPYTLDGTTLSYSVDIQVDGSLPIETSTVLVAGYWSNDDVLSAGDSPACGRLMPPGQHSGGDVVPVSFACTNSGPGTATYLIVLVDVGEPEAVAESDETNNIEAFPIN